MARDPNVFVSSCGSRMGRSGLGLSLVGDGYSLEKGLSWGATFFTRTCFYISGGR